MVNCLYKTLCLVTAAKTDAFAIGRAATNIVCCCHQTQHVAAIKLLLHSCCEIKKAPSVRKRRCRHHQPTARQSPPATRIVYGCIMHILTHVSDGYISAAYGYPQVLADSLLHASSVNMEIAAGAAV